MADSVLFDGVNDFIQLTLNGGNGITSWACAYIAKRTDPDSNWRQMGYIAENSVGAKIGMGIDGSGGGSLVVDANPQSVWTTGPLASLSNDQNWRLYVVNNPGGSNNVLGSVWDYTTGTWLATDDAPDSGGDNSETDWQIGDALYYGAWPDTLLSLADYFWGNILIAGFWAETTLDSTTRDSLRFDYPSWQAAAPNIGHRFESTSPTYFGTDNEPILQSPGGTLEDDSPAGWSDTGGPAVEYEPKIIAHTQGARW